MQWEVLMKILGDLMTDAFALDQFGLCTYVHTATILKIRRIPGIASGGSGEARSADHRFYDDDVTAGPFS
jgi:hypothetical protein